MKLEQRDVISNPDGQPAPLTPTADKQQAAELTPPVSVLVNLQL